MVSLRYREVASSASDRKGSNFDFCVWRAASSHSYQHPQEALLTQFSLYVHKGDLKPIHFISSALSSLFSSFSSVQYITPPKRVIPLLFIYLVFLFPSALIVLLLFLLSLLIFVLFLISSVLLFFSSRPDSHLPSTHFLLLHLFPFNIVFYLLIYLFRLLLLSLLLRLLSPSSPPHSSHSNFPLLFSPTTSYLSSSFFIPSYSTFSSLPSFTFSSTFCLLYNSTSFFSTFCSSSWFSSSFFSSSFFFFSLELWQLCCLKM